MKTKILGLGLLLLMAHGCGDSTSSPVPTRVVVTPFTYSMSALGETLQYAATLEDKKGKPITGATFTWTTTNTQVAAISGSGLLTGVSPGSVSIRATAEGVVGSASLTIDPAPETIEKIAGDQQTGALRELLPENPTVEVVDANGYPVEGIFVTFSVVAGGGTATPWQAQTGADGRASTVWQLGCSNDNPQRLEAKVGGLTAQFTASVDLGALAICQDQVPQGRETHPYSASLSSAGGDQSSLSWSLAGGTLPPGLALLPGGNLSGTPTQAGAYQFEARVQDGLGAQASANYLLRICEAPILLASGESRALSPTGSGECGFYLPTGESGDRYRFGVVYAQPDAISADVHTVKVAMAYDPGAGLAPVPVFRTPDVAASGLGPRIAAKTSPEVRAGLERIKATRALHEHIRAAEQELIRSLGPNARPLPDTPSPARVVGPALVSPDKVSFTNSESFSSCTVSETVRAIKVKENDLMVIYQDSLQRTTDPLSDDHAQMMLDHYLQYGAQVIDDYFGGVTDLNDDGKIVVFVTPIFDDDKYKNTVAFVWSGDFFPKVAEPGWGACAASNEMELMRFNLAVIKRISSGDYQALGTVVHESKHISSLYKSLIRSDYHDPYYQPGWVEEGTAELAEEMASRIAWAATGGPAVGAMADGSYVNAFTKENYSVILVQAGTTGYLSSQPNGVVATPDGADSDHSVYGSGWHFHRWLGDAYGNAANPLADSALLRTLNDSLTATGAEGVLAVTGASSWTRLLEEYVRAIMLNGTGAPLGPKAFTSYDFASMNRTFNYDGKPSGDYPWPVNVFGEQTTAPFATGTITGPIGPSGVRIFDLTSTGTGRGLDVKVDVPTASSPFRIVVVRIE